MIGACDQRLFRCCLMLLLLTSANWIKEFINAQSMNADCIIKMDELSNMNSITSLWIINICNLIREFAEII